SGIFIWIPVAGVVYNILYFNPAMEQLRRDVQAQQEKAIQADLDKGMVVNHQLQQSGQEPEFNGMIWLVGLLPVMVYGFMLLVVMFLPDVSPSLVITFVPLAFRGGEEEVRRICTCRAGAHTPSFAGADFGRQRRANPGVGHGTASGCKSLISTPSHHKVWLVKRIAWRLQAKAEGPLPLRFADQCALRIDRAPFTNPNRRYRYYTCSAQRTATLSCGAFRMASVRPTLTHGGPRPRHDRSR